MSTHTITVFGGHGFIGRHLIQRLAQAHARIRVATRHPESARHLQTMGNVGQIVPILTNIRDQSSVEHAITGADSVVNLVGILYEKRRQTFQSVHVEGAANIATAAHRAGISRLIHISAMGAARYSTSKYLRSKALGEQAVKSIYQNAIVVRPSIVFGPEDNFFNRFAALARISPVIPLIGAGKTRFQPVYVGDVADAIFHCLYHHARAEHIYELGGPRVYTFRELMQLVLTTTKRQRILLPLPFWQARIIGQLCRFLPVPPLTDDQVRSLEVDNIASITSHTLDDLGISSTPVEGILPTYIGRFCQPGNAE